MLDYIVKDLAKFFLKTEQIRKEEEKPKVRNSTTRNPARRKIIGYLEGGRIRICSTTSARRKIGEEV